MENSIYLIPGMRVKLSLFSDLEEGGYGLGSFVTQDKTKLLRGRTYTVLRGFAIEDEKVGELKAVEGNDYEVYYTHKMPEKNIIYCFTVMNEIVTLDIVTVPIHDHSSIVQGGPAYGTYFDDDESVE